MSKKERTPINSLGKLIKDARIERGLRQIDLAWKINKPEVTKKTINDWEKGNTFPDLDMIYLLAGMLNLNPNDMLKLKNTIQEESYTEPNWVARHLGDRVIFFSKPIVKWIIMWIEIIIVLYLALTVEKLYQKVGSPGDPEQEQIVIDIIDEAENTYVKN